MKTEQVERAVNLSDRLVQALRDAHSDAIDGGNQAEELLLSEMLDPARDIAQQLRRIAMAVGAVGVVPAKQAQHQKRFTTPDPHSEWLKRKRKAIGL